MPVLEKSTDRDRPVSTSVPFPPGVRAAGFIWVGFGIIGLISAGFSIALNAVAVAANPGQPAKGNVIGDILLVLFAVSFLVVGIEMLRGNAKGTLGKGIWSIVIGLSNAALAVMILAFTEQLPGRPSALIFAFAVVSGLLVMALLTAGMLAISGRHAYAEWRLLHGHVNHPDRPLTTSAKP